MTTVADYAWRNECNFTDADQLAVWCEENRWPDGVTKEELAVMGAVVGRNSSPLLMWELHALGLLAREAYTLTGDFWAMAEYPESSLDRTDWRDLFDSAGFTVDGIPTPKPEAPLRLWRGSAPERRARWSWTDNREVAVDYAQGRYHRTPGKLWTAHVEPWRLLCRNVGTRNESEYVVDTDGLDIEEEPVS